MIYITLVDYVIWMRSVFKVHDIQKMLRKATVCYKEKEALTLYQKIRIRWGMRGF